MPRLTPESVIAVRNTIALASMRDFAALVIAHVAGGGTLDDEALASIRAECVREVKNAEAPRIPVEQEAELFGEAVKEVEKLIDSAILKGRHGKQ